MSRSTAKRDMFFLQVGSEVRVRASRHARERVAERMLAAAAPSQAWEVLSKRLNAVASVSSTPPAWFRSHADNAAYVLIGEDFVLPLRGAEGALVASTCVARGTISSDERARRTERRSRRCRLGLSRSGRRDYPARRPRRLEITAAIADSIEAHVQADGGQRKWR